MESLRAFHKFFVTGCCAAIKLHWRHALADVKSASRIYSGLVRYSFIGLL
jgi:hypothetical protein